MPQCVLAVLWLYELEKYWSTTQDKGCHLASRNVMANFRLGTFYIQFTLPLRGNMYLMRYSDRVFSLLLKRKGRDFACYKD